MTKIQELIKKPPYEYSGGVYSFVDIEELMKEYAEWYAKKCLEIADENFNWDHDMEEWCGGIRPSRIQLPPHNEEM